MYLIILALIFILNSQTAKLQSNFNSTKNYHLHVNQERIFFRFPQVVDAQLQTDKSQPFCQLIQKNIEIYSKQIPILENHQIYEQVDDQVYPFNLKQFICMTQIKDGIIVLTTDYVIYLFELDYNAIQSNNTNQFAKKIWTTDFKQIISDSPYISEFAQIVFCTSANQALIIFESSAYLVSLKQIETQDQNLQVVSVGDWVQRSYRGLTKSIDDLVITCVGENGIDIYRSAFDSLRFIGTLDSKVLEIEQFNMKDFTLIKLKDFTYKCYFLDLDGSVYIIEIKIINFDFTFQLIKKINTQGEGISIDTKNGLNVFVAYQVSHIYQVVEYYISLNQSIYFQLNSYTTRNQIKSIDATDEFAILQGNNHHKILFRQDVFKQNSKIIPVFTYLGLRDFEIISSFSDIKTIQQGFDFLVGITSTNLLLVKFYIQPFQVKCQADQTNQLEVQFYSLIANTTKIIEGEKKVDYIITQTRFNFTMELLDSEDSENYIQDFQILFGIILFLLQKKNYDLREIDFKWSKKKLDKSVLVLKLYLEMIKCIIIL